MSSPRKNKDSGDDIFTNIFASTTNTSAVRILIDSEESAISIRPFRSNDTVENVQQQQQPQHHQSQIQQEPIIYQQHQYNYQHQDYLRQQELQYQYQQQQHVQQQQQHQQQLRLSTAESGMPTLSPRKLQYDGTSPTQTLASINLPQDIPQQQQQLQHQPQLQHNQQFQHHQQQPQQHYNRHHLNQIHYQQQQQDHHHRQLQEYQQHQQQQLQQPTIIQDNSPISPNRNYQLPVEIQQEQQQPQQQHQQNYQRLLQERQRYQQQQQHLTQQSTMSQDNTPISPNRNYQFTVEIQQQQQQQQPQSQQQQLSPEYIQRQQYLQQELRQLTEKIQQNQQQQMMLLDEHKHQGDDRLEHQSINPTASEIIGGSSSVAVISEPKKLRLSSEPLPDNRQPIEIKLNAAQCKYCLQNFQNKYLKFLHMKDTHPNLLFDCEDCPLYLNENDFLLHIELKHPQFYYNYCEIINTNYNPIQNSSKLHSVSSMNQPSTSTVNYSESISTDTNFDNYLPSTSRSNVRYTRLIGPPSVSITVCPVTWTITGPSTSNPMYRTNEPMDWQSRLQPGNESYMNTITTSTITWTQSQSRVQPGSLIQTQTVGNVDDVNIYSNYHSPQMVTRSANQNFSSMFQTINPAQRVGNAFDADWSTNYNTERTIRMTESSNQHDSNLYRTRNIIGPQTSIDNVPLVDRSSNNNNNNDQAGEMETWSASNWIPVTTQSTTTSSNKKTNTNVIISQMGKPLSYHDPYPESFKCKLCNKMHYNKIQLINHTKDNHRETLKSCPQCNCFFLNDIDADAHIRSQHRTNF